MNTRVLLLASLGLIAGCASQPHLNHQATIVKPGLVMVPADQLKYYTAQAPAAEKEFIVAAGALDTRAVQVEAPVIAQQWNRYADPARPEELMHEAHLVYRREGRTRWRLRTPPGDQQILIGPQTTDGRGEIQPLASQELESFLRDARTNLRREQDVMTRLTEGLQHVSEQQEKFAAELNRLRSEEAEPAENARAAAGDGAPSNDPDARSAHSEPRPIQRSGITNTK